MPSQDARVLRRRRHDALNRPRSRIVFLNGRYLPADQARVSALDRGLLFGDGIFEAIRVDDGRAFALEAHLERLRRTARQIELPVPQPSFRWSRCILDLLRRNGLDGGPAVARITITRGAGDGSLIPTNRSRPTILITVRRLDASIDRLQRRGAKVALLPFHPGVGGLLAGSKTLDYLTAMLGKQAARRRGAFEGIYTGPDGSILEGTTSNVFVVRAASIRTPPLRAGVLPGITRAQVIDLARHEGLRVSEARVTRRDLHSASEVFLTATTIGIVPVVAIDGRRFAGGVGAITRRLQRELSALRADRK